MLKPLIKRKRTTNNPFKAVLATALSAVMVLTCLPAVASNEDFRKEITVTADKENIDLKKNKVVFSGNVSVLQGSLAIKANQLEVIKTDKKGTEIFIATGVPATYEQVLEDGKPISAQADSIRYEVASRTLILTGSAQLKQNDSQVNGETIRYNLIKQKLVAEGGAKRVTTIFNQEKDDSQDANQDDSKGDSPK